MPQFIEKALEKIDRLDRDHLRTIMFQLYRDHRRLEEVINSLPDGIVVLDEGHRSVSSNRAARLLLPLLDESEGAPLWEGVGDDDIARYLREALQNGGGDGGAFTIDVRGSARTLQLDILPLVRQGGIVGNILRIVDITEKLIKESRLHRAEQLASLTSVTANVAHEIKNPLAAISIYIQLTKREMEKSGSLSPALAHNLTVVEEEIQRLNTTIVNFLFSVRPMELHLEEMDIHIPLDEVVTLFRPELQTAHITLTTRYRKNLPLVEIDRAHMKQAVMNIIKNAIEAVGARRGGAERQEGGGEIQICTAVVAQGVRIDVIDNGTGIRRGDMPNIFDPYFTTKDEGSGIGLTQTYKVIQEHRGEMSIVNNRDCGVTCTIVLPLPRNQQKLIGGGGDGNSTNSG